MGTTISAALGIAAAIQGVTLPLLLAGIVAGGLRLHWLLGGGHRG